MTTLPEAPPAGRRRLDYLPVSSLARALRNPKRHDLDGIAASFRQFGFVDIVAVDERTQRLISGHGRLETLELMQEQGEDPPEGIQVAEDGTWLAPVLRGWESDGDAEAEAYLVAANRHGEVGGWDRRMLAEIMGDVGGYDPALVEAAGFQPTELAELLSALEGGEGRRGGNENPHDWRPPRSGDSPDDFPSFGEDMPTEFRCPRCSHEWRGNPKPTVVDDPDD